MTSEKITTTDQLRRLLALFYEGATSPQQEAALKAYFIEHDDVEDEFKADRAIFISLSSDIPDNLEERIIAATCGKRPQPRPTSYWIRSAAAATAAIIIASTVLIHRPNRTPPPATVAISTTHSDTISDHYRIITDPAEAQRIVDEACAILDMHMALDAKTIEQTNELIKTALQ